MLSAEVKLRRQDINRRSSRCIAAVDIERLERSPSVFSGDIAQVCDATILRDLCGVVLEENV